MAILDLAATPAVRYFDPPVPRVLPNGTQPLSAYNAACLYYDPSEGKWFADIVPETFGLRPIEFVLFGTDYPALVTATSSYGENVEGSSTGANFPTFDESHPLVGSFGVSTVPYVLSAAEPVGYKQIATGLTATNGVRVQGFPHMVNAKWHGVMFRDPPVYGSPFMLALSVLMNAAVVNSSTSFEDNKTQTFPNLPVIIHEKDLTQAVIDNGYVIPSQTIDLSFIFGTLYPPLFTANFDVVGIWATNYDPLDPPYPPLPPSP
jgi:hypothetical protein